MKHCQRTDVLSLLMGLSRGLAVPTLAVGVFAASPAASVKCLARTGSIASGPAQLQRKHVVAGTAGRITDLTLFSPALSSTTHVNVMVPPGYDGSGRTRYPVLYLLHGVGGDHNSWTLNGVQSIVEGETAGKPVIVVMPDGGSFGFYSDWYGTDAARGDVGAPPAWETYHIGELIPWIDAHYPTMADRSGRAIAGLSMGGFGAMSYAAQYPGMFAAAGSFSGVVDIDHRYPYANDMLTSSSAVAGTSPEHCIWGDPRSQALRWRAVDPTYLAGNLRGISIYLASGDGRVGPLDDWLSPGLYPTKGIEGFVWPMNRSLDAELTRDAIPHTTDFYGAGTHNWPYWRRDLSHFVPQVITAFSKVPPAPQTFGFRSAAARFSAWGWRFETDRTAGEFTYLTGVSGGGLRVAGSGTLAVTTPPLYAPASRATVTVGGTPEHVIADGSGRLVFDIHLGPAHRSQQTKFGVDVTSSWARRTVVIAALPTPQLSVVAAVGAPAGSSPEATVGVPAVGTGGWVLLAIVLAALAWSVQCPRRITTGSVP